MGTHAVTLVKDNLNGDTILAMLVQCDGYLEGFGRDLADFLEPFIIRNGMGGPPPSGKKYANTMQCLAAQIVAHFKTCEGHIYLVSPETNIGDYQFTYVVSFNGLDNPPRLKAFHWEEETTIPPKSVSAINPANLPKTPNPCPQGMR